MIEVVDQLSIELQNEVLEASRQIVRQAPLFIKTMPTGAAFRYSCTSAGEYGWVSDRRGYRYEREHPVTGRAFGPIPPLIDAIARRAAFPDARHHFGHGILLQQHRAQVPHAGDEFLTHRLPHKASQL